MGGYGKAASEGTAKRTQGTKALDIRPLYRDTTLTPGFTYGWFWFAVRDGERQERGHIRVMVEGDERAERVTLRYRVRYGGSGDWQDVEEVVPVEWTACHYGARVPGSAVPSAPSGWRSCIWAGGCSCAASVNGLPYACQNERLEDRLRSKALAIRERLGQKEGGIMALIR